MALGKGNRGRSTRIDKLESRRQLSGYELDPTFGNAGARLVDFVNLGGDFATGAVVRNDGMLYALGYSDIPGVGPTGNVAVARYNVDGTLDRSYDEDGKFAFDPGHGNFARTVTPMPDGSFYVTSGYGPTDNYSGYSSYIIRFLRDGTLDPTFGQNGVRDLNIFYNNSMSAVRPLPGGKFAIAFTGGGVLRLQQFLPDGQLDPSWNGTGESSVFASVISSSGSAYAGHVFPSESGGFYVAGSGGDYGVSPFSFVLRFTAQGALDTTFGSNGVLKLTDVRGLRALERVSGGKYVGLTDTSENSVFRLNPDWSMDLGFDGDGLRPVSLGGSASQIRTFYIDGNGRFVVAGTNGSDFAALRILQNGQSDSSFGLNGLVTIDMGSAMDRIDSVVSSGDGKLYLVGGAFFGTIDSINTVDFAVARVFESNGSIDPTWGTVLTSGFTPGNDNGLGSYVLPSGKILVTSASRWYGNTETVALLNPDGTYDSSFDSDGRITGTQGSHQSTFASDVRGGKIYFLGAGYGTGVFRVIRRNVSDGSRDTTYGVDGVSITQHLPAGYDLYFVSSVKALADGSVYILGYIGGTDPGVSIIKLDPRGQLDTSYGTGGIRILTLASGASTSSEGIMCMYEDGRLLVAYKRTINGAKYIELQMLNPSGSTNTSFGTQGRTTIPMPADALVTTPTALALAPDGRIVGSVNTQTQTNPPIERPVLFRLTPAGLPDTTWSGDGRAELNLGRDAQSLKSVIIRPDGRVMAGGYVGNYLLSNWNWVLIQTEATVIAMTADGRLDTSFSGDGIYQCRQSERFGDTVNHLQLLPDGTVFATGAGGSTYRELDVLLLKLRPVPVPLSFSSAQLDLETRPTILLSQGSGNPANLSASLFELVNLTTGQTISSSLLQGTGVPGQMRIQYGGNPRGILPDGRYRLTLRAQTLLSETGIPLDGNGDGLAGDDFVHSFFVLTGDTDHNGTVDIDDLLTLAQNYGTTGRTFSQGNIDYSADGFIGFDDLLMLSQRYGTSVMQSSSPTPAKRRACVLDL